MKKIGWFLIMILIFGCVNINAEEKEVNVIASYKAQFSEKQGVDNFYFCSYENGQETVFQNIYPQANNPSDKRWRIADGQLPQVASDGMLPSGTLDVGIMFKAPMKGMVRLKGSPQFASWTLGQGGDGVNLSILKGNKKVWGGYVAASKSISYDVIVPIKKGEELKFIVNRNGNNWFDSFEWWPMVEYTDEPYVEEDDGALYFQKEGNEEKKIEYNETLGGYYADDSIAYISEEGVMPTEEYSLIKRTIIAETGQYRVSGLVYPKSDSGFGDIIKIYKNKELVWQQLFLPGESGNVDIRMYAKKDDIIDIECQVNYYVGYNYAEWSVNVTKMGGAEENCLATTTEGSAYISLSEKSLSNYIAAAGSEGVELYALKYNKKYPLTYNSQRGGYEIKELKNTFWNKSMSERGAREPWENQTTERQQQEIAFVSQKEITPGHFADTCVDVRLAENGIIKINGKLGMSDSDDGELVTIYLNDSPIWSNRIGGERSVRYDEPYGTSYFSNNIDVVANVKAGDVLTFRANSWKLYGAKIDISDVKIKYIKGNILSKTTEWKLKNSIVIDTVGKCVYINGVKETIDLYVENGTTYISANDAVKLFGQTSDVSSVYIPLRKTAEQNENTVIWVANCMAIVHKGIPVMYTWNELSEIKTEVECKGGVLFE